MNRLSAAASPAGLCLRGQTFNARITGTIKDSTDAALPSANVTAVQVDTRVKRSVKTETSGAYNIPLLLSGRYDVTVESAGLASQVRKHNVLNQVYFGSPHGTVISATFGWVGVGPSPRQGELGVRITF